MSAPFLMPEILTEGFNAAKQGVTEELNPYYEGCSAYEAWLAGWDQAHGAGNYAGTGAKAA